uniref:Pre-mRNA-splicing factor CWC25 homolog n=1 Tax=Phallusia mammillata TaxID=59560 RepID=A0A6F9DB10_9ASCI|nr:pre-mRNA-splicing factor CWC25 homolog [Phallusia mammillata]
MMAKSSGAPGESTNIQWMYEGTNSKIDREAYLLGKRISKVAEDKGDFIVEDKTNENLSVTVLEKLDYESKIREDPLISIRQKEQEKRRELLSNPIKRKHLQTVLKTALEKDLNYSSKHKKKKKSKKKDHDSQRRKKRKRHQSTETSSSNDDYGRKSDKLLKNAEKNKKLQAALKRALKEDLSGTSDLSSDEEEFKKKHKRHSTKADIPQIHKKNKEHHARNYHDISDDNRGTRSKSPNSKEIEKATGYGLQVVKAKEKEHRKPTKPKVPSPEPVKPKYQRKERPGFTKKLSKEELERKRKEMMSNAGWRDEQRKKNIKHYSAEEKHDKAREDHVQKLHDIQHKRDGKVKTFLHDMKLQQTNVGSLQDTVRRKRHTLNKSTDE